MSRAFFRAPCRLSVAGGRCLTAGRVLEGPANRPDLGRIVRGAAGMTADLVARVSLKSCELRSSPRPSLATLPLSRESICRSWKARLTGVPDCEPVPWYRFGTDRYRPMLSRIVHGPGQGYGKRTGRSEIAATLECRSAGGQKVAGSNPVAPTTSHQLRKQHASPASPRSAGPHRPGSSRLDWRSRFTAKCLGRSIPRGQS